jgi:hypothetical protein
MVGEEGIHQRVWQADDLDDRHQVGASSLPEWCLGKMFAPEDLPTGDGLPVSAESLGELSDAAGCWTLPHGADQDDDDAEINLWAEESHRRRGHSLSATVTIAAETEPEALWLWELSERATRFT